MLHRTTTDNKITIDYKTHKQCLCSMTNNLLRVLTRIRKCLHLEQAQRLSDTYIMSTFKYCLLLRIFNSKVAYKYKI